MSRGETTDTIQVTSILVQIACLIALGFFGLITGFFYAYSVDVMRGLDLIDAESAVSAMQGINLAVRNPVFFATFFGTPIVGLLAAGSLYLGNHKMSAGLMVLAAAIYFFGAFMPTAMVNVPMNEALAVIPLGDSAQDYEAIWTTYSPKWTFWNTLRTVVSLVALLFAGMALLQIGRKHN